MTLDTKAKLYILNCVDFEGSTQEKIEHIKNRFNSEYGWLIQRKGPYQAMIDWLQGLALNIAFYNSDIIQMSKEWGSIPENATEKQEEKILDNYWQFMATKTLQLVNGYRVPK